MTAYEETRMSAQAQSENPQVARPALPAPTGQARAARTPLSVVPAPLPRSGPGIAVLCALVLLASLAALLVMNVTISNRQYELLDLRAQQQQVTVANEQLRERVGTLEAPQNLAARADGLGMVPAGGTGSLDLSTGRFSDAPEDAAGSGGLSTSYVAPPAAGTRDAATRGADIEGPRTGSAPTGASADGAPASAPSSAVPSDAGTAGH